MCRLTVNLGDLLEKEGKRKLVYVSRGRSFRFFAKLDFRLVQMWEINDRAAKKPRPFVCQFFWKLQLCDLAKSSPNSTVFRQGHFAENLDRVPRPKVWEFKIWRDYVIGFFSSFFKSEDLEKIAPCRPRNTTAALRSNKIPSSTSSPTNAPSNGEPTTG